MTTSTQKQLIDLDPHSFQAQLQNSNIVLIDVREPAEFAREHIPSAQNFPLSTLTVETVPQTNKTVLLFCQSSNRSRKAAQIFHEAGYTEISHLDGGLMAWKSAGLPYIEDKKAPLPMMRQVQIVAGSLVLTGTLLSAFVSPWFLLLTGFVGSGLIFAGVSGFCGMATLLAKLPYNQVK